ncbi:MAG: hypothetical protein KA221_00490 [Vitreoscilla sp.]|jgi:hypothetical protein|nr:hypothetical protein [Vitreoscilla sp.]MBP9539577.1 hypothetical protein [Vitreoscilla sp.]
MVMLSVSELRQRKQQLEQAIAELIQVFEHETSVEVDSLLTLERSSCTATSQDTQSGHIKVEIHLNM